MPYTQKSQYQSNKLRTEKNENLIVEDVAYLIDAVETIEATVDALPAAPTTTVVNISSAQILAMGSSPIELLPDPGMDDYYDVAEIIFEVTGGATPYTLSNDLYCVYQGGAALNLDTQIFWAGNPKGVQIIRDMNITQLDPQDYYKMSIPYLGKGLTLSTYNGNNPTLGDGTIRAIITYTVRTFGA